MSRTGKVSRVLSH